MGEGDGKVKEMVSSAKRRVGAEAPYAADDDSRTGVVRGALQAFGDGDMDGFVDALKGDVAWENPEGDRFPGSGDLQGTDEVRTRFIGDVGRTYTSFGFRPEAFLETDHEDAVVVIGRFQGEGVDGGDSLDTPGVQVWGFKGSEVTQVRVFADTAAFPEVVTEKKERERAEEDRKEDEDEKSDDSDSDSEDSGDDEGPKGEGDSESSEAKSEDDSDDSSEDDSDDNSSEEDDDDTGDKAA